MISKSHIDHWRQYAPWSSSSMVEQDLIISKALVNMYQHQKIQNSLLFRGGTALNKLYIQPSARYSEDIDFVQIIAEPIGETIDAIRSMLDAWLGTPKRKMTARSAKLIYKYRTIDNVIAKLKVEINTTEHFYVLKPINYSFKVDSRWFNDEAIIRTYHIDELMATKIRALYQRSKGRDLFDIWHAVTHDLFELENSLNILGKYNNYNQENITRAMFEQNFFEKQQDINFRNDTTGLLPVDYNWNYDIACELVWNKVVPHMKGEAWKNNKE
ncbi:MAG: nucleotidyl transferase AbiEii/AbiGii toxin family protein [Gammaproteobacteria bacterium]|nr:nucleotidyl transferase AbiEii/AbiGii toxin family protein [Gammaproteobacteria bacterium]